MDSELDHLLYNFKKAYHDFCLIKGFHENTSLQNCTTQFYWNVLELQKQRLKSKGIELDFSAERQKYTEKGPVQVNKYFDGKYEISEIQEEIEAHSHYSKNGKEVYDKKSSQLAFYTIINAKEQGPNEIICPHCGNVTTRENLLDGCDYCRTKFTVEDLGSRIGNFALRADYDIIEEKFKQTRQSAGDWLCQAANVIGAAAGFLVSIIILPFISISFLMKLGVGLILMFIGASMASGFINSLLNTGANSPLNLVAYGVFVNQELTNSLPEKDELNPTAAASLKQQDPLFSFKGFIGNIQNKLAAMFYAQTTKQINAFADCPMDTYLKEYQDILDSDILNLTLQEYHCEDDLQRIKLTAKLQQLLYTPQEHIIERQEKVGIELIKSASCKTQAIHSPHALVCRGCGASLSLLEGKTCSYCGSELDLKQFDWVIADYKVLERKDIQTIILPHS